MNDVQQMEATAIQNLSCIMHGLSNSQSVYDCVVDMTLRAFVHNEKIVHVI